LGCAGGAANQPGANQPGATPPGGAPGGSGTAVEVPVQVTEAIVPREAVARGLRNPRGLYVLPSGAMLVSEAGTGLVSDPNSGRLLRLEDRNHDGLFLDEGERHVVLDRQPSKNLIQVVRRDEVFGMAGIDAGGGDTLVALAFFGGPSTIFKVDGDVVTQWGSTHGNINDIAFDPVRKQWFGVSSTTDEIVRLLPGGGSERVVKIPPLPNGQDPVPANLRYDRSTGDLLVTLFSGSPEGEEGGAGVEIQPRAGGIVAIHPETKSFRWIVKGLTVPTDLEIGPDGTLYVLEFCDAFLDPAQTVEALLDKPSHGGFKRFSGRLLRIDRRTGGAAVLAEHLDAPTNLTLAGSDLYVSEGMGTPGREIPGPSGIVKLDGMIERIRVSKH
jgi:hypothetical protein